MKTEAKEILSLRQEKKWGNGVVSVGCLKRHNETETYQGKTKTMKAMKSSKKKTFCRAPEQHLRPKTIWNRSCEQQTTPHLAYMSKWFEQSTE